MGLSVLIAAKALKARVIITDLYDEKLEYAKKFGADVALNVRGKDLGQLLNQLGEKPNVIIDGVCTKQSLEQAVDMVSSAGRVVELGFGEIKSEIPHVTLMKKEVDVCGTRLQTGQFPKAIRYIEENTNLLDDFVTQEFSAEDVEKAFRFVSENPALVRKAQVCFE